MLKTISIISDWQKDDFYLTNVKTHLQQHVSGYQIMDVSHNIQAFDSMQAAFVLRSVWRGFPKGSIHLFCVNSASSLETPHVLIEHKGHFFIGADLGYWPFILGRMPESAYILNNETEYEGSSFPELNIFAQVAIAVSKNIMAKDLGGDFYLVKSLTKLNPEFNDKSIFASIVYFDSFGNAITNLSKDQFERHCQTDDVCISLISEKYRTKKIVHSYLNVDHGEILALFNSQNLLEIALREGNIKQMLDLQLGDQVRIDLSL